MVDIKSNCLPPLPPLRGCTKSPNSSAFFQSGGTHGESKNSRIFLAAFLVDSRRTWFLFASLCGEAGEATEDDEGEGSAAAEGDDDDGEATKLSLVVEEEGEGASMSGGISWINSSSAAV